MIKKMNNMKNMIKEIKANQKISKKHSSRQVVNMKIMIFE